MCVVSDPVSERSGKIFLAENQMIQGSGMMLSLEFFHSLDVFPGFSISVSVSS